MDYLEWLDAYKIDPNRKRRSFSLTGLWDKQDDLIAFYALVVYLVPFIAFDYFFKRRHLLFEKAKHETSIFQVAFNLALSIGLYDFLFFLFHSLMHQNPYLYKFLNHGQHHSQGGRLFAIDVLRHSFLDGSAQVFTNVFVLNILRIPPLSRALHNIVIIYLLTESHSGFNLPFSLSRLFSFYGGSVHHEVHHATGVGHYQQLGKYWDDYFNTSNENWLLMDEVEKVFPSGDFNIGWMFM